jgi:uncharacterized RDD family membrane protein YckC
MTESTDASSLVDWSAPQPAAKPRFVEDDVEPAGHVGRLLAWIVDGFVVSLVAIALFLFGGMVGLPALGVLIAYVVSFAYLPYYWSRSGQTPGMAIFGLRLVRTADLGKVGVGASIIRLLGLWLSAVILYVGIIWILFEGKRRGWHDLFAGTRMIKDPG